MSSIKKIAGVLAAAAMTTGFAASAATPAQAATPRNGVYWNRRSLLLLQQQLRRLPV